MTSWGGRNDAVCVIFQICPQVFSFSLNDLNKTFSFINHMSFSLSLPGAAPSLPTSSLQQQVSNPFSCCMLHCLNCTSIITSSHAPVTTTPMYFWTWPSHLALNSQDITRREIFLYEQHFLINIQRVEHELSCKNVCLMGGKTHQTRCWAAT